MLTPLLITLPLLAFYLWMFWDMAHNASIPDRSTAPLDWPPSTKFQWVLAFIVLSVLTAGYYYFTEYKKR